MDNTNNQAKVITIVCLALPYVIGLIISIQQSTLPISQLIFSPLIYILGCHYVYAFIFKKDMHMSGYTAEYGVAPKLTRTIVFFMGSLLTIFTIWLMVYGK